MGNLSNTNHDIYKKRGRLNIQIGLVLGGFVLLVLVATIYKFGFEAKAKLNAENQVTQEVSE